MKIWVFSETFHATFLPSEKRTRLTGKFCAKVVREHANGCDNSSVKCDNLYLFD
jgi:hypothetical protein